MKAAGVAQSLTACFVVAHLSFQVALYMHVICHTRAPFVVLSNTVLDTGPGSPLEGEIQGWNPQFAATPSIVKMLSVTLVHPAKAHWNDMPYGRDSRMVLSNTVLDKWPRFLAGRGALGWEPPVRSNAIYCQIALALV